MQSSYCEMPAALAPLWAIYLLISPVGNRLQQSSLLGTTKYVYDSADRLITAGSRAFTYDANGNRASVTDASIHQTRTFTYDAANRLTTATGPKNSSFAYDGDGNRIMQSVGSGTYNYVNDVAAGLPVALQESGPDGSITYAYGLGLIEEAAPTFNYFYQYDGLGSVIGFTDAKGILQGAYAYDAWGNTVLSVTDVGTRNKFRFTGQALDPGTGLYFLRARYYDSSVGRFINKDPLATPNRYSYSSNNPVLLTDPSGMYSFSDFWNSPVTSTITSAALLSASTAAKGTVQLAGIVANVAGNAVGWGAQESTITNQIGGFFRTVQQKSAASLVQSVGALEAVNLSPETANTISTQVVSVTEYANLALSLASAPTDIAELAGQWATHSYPLVQLWNLEQLTETGLGTYQSSSWLFPQLGSAQSPTLGVCRG
jgi:RHS repeat-associated protein